MTDSPFAEWCWNLRVSVAIRGAPWPFPALEILHIVGLILVFGTVLILDLRLLGVLLRREPAWQISADLTRWAWPGFALQLLTGPLLFVIQPPIDLAQQFQDRQRVILRQQIEADRGQLAGQTVIRF